MLSFCHACTIVHSVDTKKLAQRLKQQKKTSKARLSVRVDDALMKSLLAFAKANKVSVTDVVETLLKDLFEPKEGQ